MPPPSTIICGSSTLISPASAAPNAPVDRSQTARAASSPAITAATSSRVVANLPPLRWSTVQSPIASSRLPGVRTMSGWPAGSSERCPTCPARPRCPRRSRPSTMAAPPTPVPSVIINTFVPPRAAPSHTSPSKAACASFRTTVGRPSSPDQSSPSSPRSLPGMLTIIFSSRDASPGAHNPATAIVGKRPCRPATTRRTLSRHAPPAPSSVGRVSSACTRPHSSTTSPLTWVPPRSMPKMNRASLMGSPRGSALRSPSNRRQRPTLAPSQTAPHPTTETPPHRRSHPAARCGHRRAAASS